MVSTSPFALRFPKQRTLDYSGVSPSSSETIDGTSYLKPAQGWGLVIAPRKYSEVAKVRFHVSVGNNSGTTDFTNCRLRVWVNSTTNDPTDPDIQEIAAGGQIGDASGANGFFTSSIVDRHFQRIGSGVLVNGGGSTNDHYTLTVEFDVFDAASQDFFQAWNAAASADGYIQFQASVAFDSGPAITNFQFNSFGITVIQAPSSQNNTTSYRRVWPGRQAGATGLTVFDKDNATTHDQIRGAWRFIYNAADWDGISGFHVLTMWGNANNFDSLTIRLHRLDSETQAGASSTVLATSTIDFSALASNSRGVHRTEDWKSFLVDGQSYVIDWRHENPSSGGFSSGVDMQIEMVQQGCTRTLTWYDVGNSVSQGLFGYGGATPQMRLWTTVINPLDFANYPDSFFIRKNSYNGMVHDTAANDPLYTLLMNSDLTEDPNGPSAVTPTTAVIFQGSSTPNAVAPRWTWQELDFSPDPINLAGSRRLYARYDGSWNAGNNTHPGAIGLLYSFQVPEREVLDLAPVFPLDAFNPEGCASTSAGGGDPGVLIISNGSTIPQKYDPVENAVSDAGVPPPFCDEIPSFQVDNAALSPAGGLFAGTYRYRYTFRNCCTGKESDPSPDTIVVSTAGASPAAQVTFSFANVRIPGDEQICEICLYRSLVDDVTNTIMAKVGCFNVDETSIFVDTLADSELDFVNEGLSLLNGAMPCVPVVVEFQNRIFGLGDIPQLSPVGTVSAVTGSDIITGSFDVEWDRCLAGKFIQLQGDCRAYEIDKVLPPAAGVSPPIQRLKLVEEYEGDSQSGALYTICGHANRLYFSEPFEPECWPALNFIDVEPGDGDRLIGGVSNFGRLVICKRRKTYVLTFRENPLTEVVVPARVSSDIGCIAPRSFAQVEVGSVWLAERGLALYDGRGVQHVPESADINDIFIDPENPRYVRRDRNGRVIDAVGVFYPKREQYLLLLPTVQTTRGCNLMLVWDVKMRNITLLEFCQEFQSMVVAKDADGNERVYLGDTSGFVWIFDVGDTDGVGTPGVTGTVRGTVTAAGVDGNGASFLDDSTASFIEGGLPDAGGLSGQAGLTPSFGGGNLGLAGVCVFTREAGADPDDPWVQRTVWAATNTRLYVTPAWGSDEPEAGYDYMVGPIEFEASFKPRNYGTDDVLKRNWRQVVTHIVEDQDSELRVEILPDFSQTDDEEDTIFDGTDTLTRRTFKMSFSKGRQVRPVGRRITNFEAIRMTNFAPEEPIRLLNHILGKEVRASR